MNVVTTSGNENLQRFCWPEPNKKLRAGREPPHDIAERRQSVVVHNIQLTPTKDLMNDGQRRDHTGEGSINLFIRDLIVPAQIGIYASERTRVQNVRVDISVSVERCTYPFSAENVLDYNVLRDGVHAIISLGHIEYQETLCQHILSMCLSIPRVSYARVSVAKLEAFPDCSAVGCEMERCGNDEPLDREAAWDSTALSKVESG